MTAHKPAKAYNTQKKQPAAAQLMRHTQSTRQGPVCTRLEYYCLPKAQASICSLGCTGRKKQAWRGASARQGVLASRRAQHVCLSGRCKSVTCTAVSQKPGQEAKVCTACNQAPTKPLQSAAMPSVCVYTHPTTRVPLPWEKSVVWVQKVGASTNQCVGGRVDARHLHQPTSGRQPCNQPSNAN